MRSQFQTAVRHSALFVGDLSRKFVKFARSQWDVINDPVLWVLMLFGAGMTGGSAWLHGNINDVGWWDGFWQNFSTEMFGAFLTYYLLDKVIGSRQEKRRLIRDMASAENVNALMTLRELDEKKWLHDGSLVGAKLEKANLQGADFLRGANLERVIFTGANLAQCRFFEANLSRSQLIVANLAGSSLTYTNFQYANLFDANMQECNLFHSNFYKANLMGTNLRRAFLKNADLRGTNLESAYLDGAILDGAIADETTTLPNGSVWTPETDWDDFTGLSDSRITVRTMNGAHDNGRSERKMPRDCIANGRAQRIASGRRIHRVRRHSA